MYPAAQIQTHITAFMEVSSELREQRKNTRYSRLRDSSDMGMVNPMQNSCIPVL